jgi:hypothetical protein
LKQIIGRPDGSMPARGRDAGDLEGRPGVGAGRVPEGRGIGPLRCAAMLLGLDSEQAPRLLVLLMVLCCDPMAIVLVIAASAQGWPYYRSSRMTASRSSGLAD